MMIREAAALIGVDPHVLRHWEDMGVLCPPRAANGYRNYDEESLTRLRVILGCRDAGLSLEQTRQVMHRNANGRKAVITARADQIDQQVIDLQRTRRFLDHVLTCQHSVMSRCQQCSDYGSVTNPLG